MLYQYRSQIRSIALDAREKNGAAAISPSLRLPL
jgi:hypothetical protein